MERFHEFPVKNFGRFDSRNIVLTDLEQVHYQFANTNIALFFKYPACRVKYFIVNGKNI